ncbi:sensor histidine kinase [Aurantiacibacter flavus]|uniref:histidine kinase n=1 Tax=Aurantiacibacter flavus TaxID=3145232 RepID=A0ABV0D0W7_9SPHN
MPPPPMPASDPVTSLAEAMVVNSNTPLIMLDESLTIIAASLSFCRAFGVDCATLPGSSILDMGDGEWDVARLKSLLRATGSGGADIKDYEMLLPATKGHVERSLKLSAHRLEYEGSLGIRLLLTVVDTTEAKAAEKEMEALIANNVMLMQELQHRVANSLQIIASVLMQSARRVSNDETRSHLQMAQNRVMSIATIQKQLSQSGPGDVKLRPYLEQLCESIGISMIADPDILKIKVDVMDGSSVTSANSVSLGLIVTELVINSLKHAYPVDQGGIIKVRYVTNGSGWTLEVEDDGVGMPVLNKPKAVAGLGTNIVEALARQLQAKTTISDGKPGTRISIQHKGAEDSGGDPMPKVAAL